MIALPHTENSPFFYRDVGYFGRGHCDALTMVWFVEGKFSEVFLIRLSGLDSELGFKLCFLFWWDGVDVVGALGFRTKGREIEVG